jgi:hypothetical protein
MIKIWLISQSLFKLQLVAEISRFSIEKLLTCKYISNGNLGFVLFTWHQGLKRERGSCN